MTHDVDAEGLWRDAVRAAQVFALAPERLGGLRIRAPAGPVRDALVAIVAAELGDRYVTRRLPVAVTEEALLGGPDLSASLETGRLVRRAGLLASAVPLLLVVPLAERLDPGIAACLARAIETPPDAPIACIALDDSRDDDAPPNLALCERLGVTIDVRTLSSGATGGGVAPLPASTREAATHVLVPDGAIDALCRGSLALGIASLRASIHAVTFARMSAAAAGRTSVSDDDLAFAARFVLAPRATTWPGDATEPEPPPAESEASAPEQEPPPPPPQSSDGDKPDQEQPRHTENLEDLVVAAVRTALPQGLLGLTGAAQRTQARRIGKSGAKHAARRRGRPLTSRPGRLSDGRLDLLATLKAAVPWQRLRKSADETQRLAVRRSDIHIRRHSERSESLTIFVVDASGSTAAQRLAEAKGAVELLLADCYVRRDQVALIAFRKTEASILLPPTRSLVRAKRLLAEMPSGGGTPFASAIAAATDLADAARRSGLSPLIVFLTDGGANIARDGAPDRVRAEQEARQAARRSGNLGHRALLVDVSFRDRPFTREISSLLGARHVNLPRAEAASLARAVAANSPKP